MELKHNEGISRPVTKKISASIADMPFGWLAFSHRCMANFQTALAKASLSHLPWLIQAAVESKPFAIRPLSHLHSRRRSFARKDHEGSGERMSTPT